MWKPRHWIGAVTAALLLSPVVLIPWFTYSIDDWIKQSYSTGRKYCTDPSGPPRTEEQCRLAYERRLSERAQTCALPTPNAHEKVVLIDNSGGRKALSNLAIGAEDATVYVAYLDVEPGDEPLYVIARSHDAIIWHLTGATHRVSRFAAFTLKTTPGGKMLVGISGVPRDRVALDNNADCFHDIVHVPTLQAIIDRPPDHTITADGLPIRSVPSGLPVETAALPSMRPMAATGPSAAVWREARRYFPGGVADLDQNSVAALFRVKPYDVLPSEAGIAQLIERGALEPGNFQRARVFGNFTVVGDVTVTGMKQTDEYLMPMSFKIVRKIRLPTGLGGAHSVKFVLAKGVEMPDGDPGHSTIVSEETGEEVRRPIPMPRLAPAEAPKFYVDP